MHCMGSLGGHLRAVRCVPREDGARGAVLHRGSYSTRARGERSRERGVVCRAECGGVCGGMRCFGPIRPIQCNAAIQRQRPVNSSPMLLKLRWLRVLAPIRETSE